MYFVFTRSRLGCRHELFQFQLLAVHLLSHTIDTIVAAIEYHLDKFTTRTCTYLLLAISIVRLYGKVVPKVGTYAVAHTS